MPYPYNPWTYSVHGVLHGLCGESDLVNVKLLVHERAQLLVVHLTSAQDL